MGILGFLILFPMLVAFVLLFIKQDKARAVVVYGGAAIIAITSIATVIMFVGQDLLFECESQIIEYVCLAIGVALSVIVLKYAFTYKNILAGVLALIQLAGSLVFDIVVVPQAPVECGLYIDSLSVLMTFIIGVIGSAICVYALGYMQDFQHHEPEGAKDRRPVFFALMFLFLGAMFLIVFSNNMAWMFTGWEITTVCSFLLIGYTRTDEAIANSFRQIIMNILGGLGFLLALYLSVIELGTLDFQEFIAMGVTMPALVAIPCTALAFAGLTKAAQMPFHTWLLGAMVAPTPTSALLHSSTMVKAGVFLLVKLAPIMMVCTIPSVMVTVVGGFTFMVCSFLAISQSNGKRVLAYSTIANLGLIAACAGIGTPEAVWAASFLILFHAVAKSLLFLCVGTAEHHIGSRDIEAMDLLFERMPKLARLMMLGILCMFIAPFGMLIAKWATIVSFVNMGNLPMIIMLGFGSAATFFFWVKWLGKLSGIAGCKDNVEETVHTSEWIPLRLMAALICVFCVTIPVISSAVVLPYISQAYSVYGTSMLLYLAIYSQGIADFNLWLASACCLIVIIALFGFLGKCKSRQVDIYLAGATAEAGTREFRNSLGGSTMATAKNWYLQNIFGEKVLTLPATVFTIVIIVLAFMAAFFMPGFTF